MNAQNVQVDLRPVFDLMAVNIAKKSMSDTAPNLCLPCLIPLYQRGYAWETKTVDTLLTDLVAAFVKYGYPQQKNAQIDTNIVSNNEKKQSYYLSSIVAFRRQHEGVWEIVDGQQRLTTLTLLYRLLGLIDGPCPVVFENRPNSTRFLKTFFETGERFTVDDSADVDVLHLDTALATMGGDAETFKRTVFTEKYLRAQREGFTQNKTQKELDDELDEAYEAFCAFLRSKEEDWGVKVFWVELPEHTDVSAYFEVMNNRGKQLEPHEVVKGKLMLCYKEEMQKNRKNSTEIDVELKRFAKRWEWCADFSDSRQNVESKAKDQEASQDEDEAKVEAEAARGGGGINVRMTFPDLLLIALSCYLNRTVELDKDKLNAIFTKEWEHIKCNPEAFLKKLEAVRDYIDSYLVRSYLDRNRHLCWIPPRKWRKNPLFVTSSGHKIISPFNLLFKLQALLMVVYGNNRTWIRDLLREDLEVGEKGDYPPNRMLITLENGIRKSPAFVELKRTWENSDKNAMAVMNTCLCRGTYTPRIVLTLLDYLFWIKEVEKWEVDQTQSNDSIPTCIFRDRDSIEHFYPQNPENGINWENDDLNSIGNLYLVTTSENSWLSNNLPKTKVEMWEKEQKRSKMPKQAVMYATAKGPGWSPGACRQHANRCLELLLEFLGKSSNNETKEPDGVPEVSSSQDVQESELDNEQESRPEGQELTETPSQVSEWDVDDGIKQWWEKVEQALQVQLGEIKDDKGHRWRELYLAHVKDYDDNHKKKGLIIRLCINRQVYIGAASIDSATWKLLKGKYDSQAYIPFDAECREWQDDELDELVEVLKRSTVAEILQGLRKSPASGSVPGQE